MLKTFFRGSAFAALFVSFKLLFTRLIRKHIISSTKKFPEQTIRESFEGEKALRVEMFGPRALAAPGKLSFVEAKNSE